MSDAPRSVTLTRDGLGRYRLVNGRGVELVFGDGDDLLSPVELLLGAIGGCSSVDVDYVASRRAEPVSFTVTVQGTPVTDPGNAHRLDDIVVDFAVAFPEGEAGQAAAAVVPRTVAQSRDRLCTVSRTVAHETSVSFTVDGEPAPA